MSHHDELTPFEKDLLTSLRQAKRGEYARVHTPDEIQARTQKTGRPVGSLKANPKVQTTLRLDAHVLTSLRATGKGWQTRVNDILSDWLKSHTPSKV